MRTIVAVVASLVFSSASFAGPRQHAIGNWKPATDAAVSGRATFIAVEPCRVVDTRGAAGAYGGPAFAAFETRTYDIPAGPCTGIPAAAAYSLNFTIVSYDVTSGGWLTAFPAGTARPNVSTVNFGNGSNAVANAALVPATTGSISVFAAGATHVIIDINGYFVEQAISGVAAGPGLTGGGTTGIPTLSADFSPSGGINGTSTKVARADHTHYARTIIVPASGTPAQNGTALLNAMNAITGNAASTPYLVKLDAGVYDLGTSVTLNMKPYVDLEGSGEGVTTVTHAGGYLINPTIYAADASEIRFLTVDSTGGGATTHSTAVRAGNGSSRFRHMTVKASGATAFGEGIYVDAPGALLFDHVTVVVNGPGVVGINSTSSAAAGVWTANDVDISGVATSTYAAYGIQNNAALNAHHVTIALTHSGTGTTMGIISQTAAATTLDSSTVQVSATGFAIGVENVNTPAAITSSTVVASSSGSTSYGVYNTSASVTRIVTIENSRITGGTNTVFSGAPFVARIGASRLDGGPVGGGGAVTCAGVYDENFSFSASTCP